jgi:prefoldin subunit 5
MTKRTVVHFAVKTAISTLLFAALLVGTSSVRKALNKDHYVNTRHTLPAVVQENAIILSEVKGVDASSPILYIELDKLIDELKKNIEAYSKSSDDVSYLTKNNPDLLTRSNNLIAKETELLKPFNQKHAFYRKVLEYRPQIDLGSLHADLDSEEAAYRIDTSISYLEQLSKGLPIKSEHNPSPERITVPFQVQESIKEAITCLRNTKESALTKNNETFQNSIKKCDELYVSVRQSTTNEILSSLKTDEFNKLLEDLTSLNSNLRSQFSNANNQHK